MSSPRNVTSPSVTSKEGFPTSTEESVLFPLPLGPMIAWISPSLITLTLGFALQVVSFALYIPASVHYANIIIDEKDTVKAQMMFNLMQAGGAVFSSIIGGWLIDFSGISHALLVGAILSCIGTMIAFTGIQNTKR